MKGDAKEVRDSIFTAYRQFGRAVRDDRWHMIVYPHINRTQLFDLQNDPHETKDLAGDPMHAKTIERLTDRLKTWQKDLGDTQPLQSEKPMSPKFEIPKNLPKKKSAAARLPDTSNLAWIQQVATVSSRGSAGVPRRCSL
jgi:arylsulfatase A-like enzyme